MSNFISIKTVAENLLRNPLMKNINFESIIYYTVDFIGIVGMPKLFIENTVDINIKKYRGELPCNLTDIIQARWTYCGQVKPKSFPMRYATDSFASKHHCNNSPDLNCKSDLTYSIQGSIIYTSQETGVVTLAYRGVPIDEEGYPMIPENPRIRRALESYIKVQYYTILYENMLLTRDILDRNEQEYCWNVGAAEAELLKLTPDDLENIKNIWNRLIISFSEHDTSYKNLGQREVLKK